MRRRPDRPGGSCTVGRGRVRERYCAVHVVIMGCGRVGLDPGLRRWTNRRPPVAVIDQDARRRSAGCRPTFGGRTVTGVGFDREVLVEAGIEQADGVRGGVSSGDNSNILAARVARETFGVENVVARIYDPRPGRGLPAARHPDRGDGALDRRPDAAPAAARRARAAEWPDASGAVRLAEVHVRPVLGRAARSARLEEATRARVAVPDPARARAWCPTAAPCFRKATWCTCSAVDGRSTRSAERPRPQPPRGGDTDARRHRRCRQRRPLDRRRADRERARGAC